MKKIYVRNNYLIIEWTGSAPLMRPKKDISFRRTNANHNQYMIADRSQPIPGDLQTVLWSDFIKEDNTPFASIVEFNNWITENTGNFKSGSEHGEFEPIEHDLAEFKNESSNPFLRSDQMPPKGDKGDKGDRGDQGIQGIQGVPGKDGINGIDGKDGKDGLNGTNGVDGAKGEQGEEGLKGDIGLTGAKGDKGDKGDVGATGQNGAQGIQGIQGIKGDTGSQGIQGVKGDKGDSGVNSISIPTLRTPINKATAYQALNTSKPAIITITLTSTSSFSLTGNISNSANIIIGSTNAVATGTGNIVGKYNNALGGGLVVGVAVTNTSTQTYTINLPAGWFFAVLNSNSTTGVTIDTVIDQTVG